MWGVLVIKFLEALIGHCCSFVRLPVVQDQDKTSLSLSCPYSLVFPEPFTMKGHPCVLNIGPFAGLLASYDFTLHASWPDHSFNVSSMGSHLSFVRSIVPSGTFGVGRQQRSASTV